MFDVIGLATVCGRPLPAVRSLREAFTKEPWGKHDHVRLNIDSPECVLVGLRRAADPGDTAESAGCRLLVIGEVFARFSSRRFGPGRLSAGTLLRAYGESGTAIVDEVKGNYTLIVLDGAKRTIEILSSHFAVSPLYYTRVEGALCFGTSLGTLGSILTKQPDIDAAAVVETALFNWPFHERTFLKGVMRTAPGTVMSFSGDGFTRRTYWDQRTLYRAALLGEAEALEEGSALFHRCANAAVSDRGRICASFTSGFDSRAIHAVLEKDHREVLSYSFGTPGSVNVSIPEKICAQMHFPFRSFYLDRRYEDVFSTFARQTVALSDGCVVQRANYPYAFRELSDFAPAVVTGIFGSEFLRTFQNLGEFVSGNFVRLNHAADPLTELRMIIARESAHSYLLPEVYAAASEDIESDVASWFSRSSGFDRNERLHLYLLEEASRKYFGAEVGTERVYATNLFPFLDVDFFEFIFRAPFAGVHSRAVTPTVSDRVRSQYFYAYLIRKYRPALLPYTTDHGYPPGDLLKRSPVLYAGSKFVWSRIVSRMTRHQEFTPVKWVMPFFHRELFSGREDDHGIISPLFHQEFASGAWADSLAAFDKIAALKLWLEGSP